MGKASEWGNSSIPSVSCESGRTAKSQFFNDVTTVYDAIVITSNTGTSALLEFRMVAECMVYTWKSRRYRKVQKTF